MKRNIWNLISWAFWTTLIWVTLLVVGGLVVRFTGIEITSRNLSELITIPCLVFSLLISTIAMRKRIKFLTVADSKLAMYDNVEKPELVAFALGLLWLAIGSDVVHGLVNFYFYPPSPENTADVGQFAVYAGAAGLLFLIAKRRNWARLVYALTFFPISILSVPRLVSSLFRFPVPTVVGLLSVFAVVCGTVLLFLPVSSRWFTSRNLGEDAL